MKKLTLIVAAMSVLFLTACIEENQDMTGDFNSVCLDGVQYWYLRTGNTAALAVRVDPETMTFVLCEKAE